MKFLKILIYTIISTLILTLKCSFFVRENLLFDNPIYTLELVMLFGLFCLGIRSIFMENEKLGLKINVAGKLLLAATIAVLVSSFLYNSNKKIITGYDAIALYDARAKFMESGLSLKQIVNIAPYDFLHKNYYVSYPPLTSLIHYYWETFVPIIPVGVVYSVFLLLLFLVVMIGLNGFVGTNLAILIALAVIVYPQLFSLSLVEYTNLPFILFVAASVLSFSNFLFSRTTKSNLFFGSMFLVGSMWTRSSEPVWIPILASLLLVNFAQNRRKDGIKSFLSVWMVLSFISIVVSYLSWRMFVNQNYTGSLLLTVNGTLFESVFRSLVNGSALVTIFAIINYWGWLLALYFISLLIVVRDKRFVGVISFFKLLLLGNIGLYVAGVYLFSLNYYWWVDIAKDSLIRSSLCLLPASVGIVAIKAKEIIEDVKKSA